jgi:hypothetical protein
VRLGTERGARGGLEDVLTLGGGEQGGRNPRSTPAAVGLGGAGRRPVLLQRRWRGCAGGDAG